MRECIKNERDNIKRGINDVYQADVYQSPGFLSLSSLSLSLFLSISLSLSISLYLYPFFSLSIYLSIYPTLTLTLVEHGSIDFAGYTFAKSNEMKVKERENGGKGRQDQGE